MQATDALPGTTEYLPELIARARTTHPDLPIDPVIIQSLLICLIAQPRLCSGSTKTDKSNHIGLHLILRTKEEDIGLLVSVVALVSAFFAQDCLPRWRNIQPTRVAGFSAGSLAVVINGTSILAAVILTRRPDSATYTGGFYAQTQDQPQNKSIECSFATPQSKAPQFILRLHPYRKTRDLPQIPVFPARTTLIHILPPKHRVPFPG